MKQQTLHDLIKEGEERLKTLEDAARQRFDHLADDLRKETLRQSDALLRQELRRLRRELEKALLQAAQQWLLSSGNSGNGSPSSLAGGSLVGSLIRSLGQGTLSGASSTAPPSFQAGLGQALSEGLSGLLRGRRNM